MENIEVSGNAFLLNTRSTSYLIQVDSHHHVRLIHYGKHVSLSDNEALTLKMDAEYGCSVMYSSEDATYSLDAVPQEFSTTGQGDYREPSLILDQEAVDFQYQSYEILKQDVSCQGLPSAYGCSSTLVLHLQEPYLKLSLDLYYGIYDECDVISRHAVLTNHGTDDIRIHKMMSYCLDLLQEDLVSGHLYGGWANEMNLVENEIGPIGYTHGSRTGTSSGKANPAFYLRKKNASEQFGEVWGFNLIYSGSHYESIAMDEKGSVRIQAGVQPDGFNYILKPSESFCAPQAVLTYSHEGLNGMSAHFHDFINEHIVRGPYKKKDRPILINSWEGFMFDFNKAKLVSLASSAADLGMELFVLDDGWFIGRNDDHAGLGDYEVNTNKLPGGLQALAEAIRKKGMMFGIWVEPEAVNPNSNLYRAHPDWAIEDKGRPTLYGRNELLLDLTRKEVRDYIVENVCKTLDCCKADYVKWDMNRQQINSSAYSYQYMLGLYEVLGRIFDGRQILFESCSSGGNRFDLGMMCYSPQVWTSDNTDGIERIRIQKNASLFYPLSVMGAHVSASVSSQALRSVPLNTRFNISCFGDLGYELDLALLSPMEKQEVKKQVAYYKEHRKLFQYGRFTRFEESEGKESFEVSDGSSAIVGKFRRQMHVKPGPDRLHALHLKEGNYKIASREFVVDVKTLGNLINFVSPVHLDPNGPIVNTYSKFSGLNIPAHHYKASDGALAEGIILHNLFNSTGYNQNIRVPLDFGSELYLIEEE